MKYLARLGLAIAIGVTATATAVATPIELTLTSGTGTGSSILLPSTVDGSTVIYSSPDFNGWRISLAWGMSNSPSLAFGGLDLSTNTACVAASCSPLTIAVSDVGFSQSVSPDFFGTGLSYTNLGETPSTITQWAYFDTSNTYFGSTDPNAMADFGGAYDADTAGLIGTLTVNGSATGAALNGGSGATGPYSLTLVDQFCSNPANGGGTCAGGVSFSSDGGITASEPGTLALLSASLLGCALLAGRRRSSKARA